MARTRRAFATVQDSNDKAAVLAAVQRRPENFIDASDQLRRDRDFVMTVLRIAGRLLQYVLDEDLKVDKDVVLVAVQQSGLALQYASEDLKNKSKQQSIYTFIFY